MRWSFLQPYLQWRIILPIFAALGVGAGATIASVEINKFTSTEKFCSTSCHSMTPLTADPHYQKSAHFSNSAGIRPSCGSCHVPTTNWFIETYTHISSGIHDVIAQATIDFDDRKGWEARRLELAKGVRNNMGAQGNVTCKSCHTPASITPASQTGQVVHASLPEDAACASCHRNLVHSRPGALSAAEEISMIARAMDGWVHSRNLSNKHAQKGISCSGCHGNDLIPDANASGPNAKCATCHGGIEAVAQAFKGPPNLNPHTASLGKTPCGSCHQVHEAKAGAATETKPQ